MTLSLFGDEPEPRELPPGLVVVENWLTLAQAVELLAAVDQMPWVNDLSRRVQHYGWKYDYTLKDLNPDQYLGPLPQIFAAVLSRLASVPEFGAHAEQIIVNEYLPGQGIAAHVDRNTFGPVVASVSLGSEWPMEFSSPTKQNIEVFVPVGALLLMTGPSRYSWTHQIRPRRADKRHGQRIPRVRRVSITFRTLDPSFARTHTQK